MNKVMLIGRLTRDPELRYIPSGTSVCDFGMAMNRKRKDAEEVTFVDITAWGKQAETIAQYCKKGQQFYVEGRLTADEWQTQDGQKRRKLKVTLEGFEFLGKAEKREEDYDDSDAPF